MLEFGPQEFVNRIINYKKEQEKPKFGDVVEIEYISGNKGRGIFIGERTLAYDVICPDTNYPLQELFKDIVKSITKTGEHIDIRGMLDKLA